MSYEVLARKYRPANFEEVVGQEHIVQAISNGISQERIHQSYIFSGTRGVGKTTLARILAKCLNCLSSENPTSKPCDGCTNCNEIKSGRNLDFLEIDAASKTGIDDMRDLLETVPQSPSSGRYKVYLIDEVHMLSKSSFNALLKTLEEPPSHVVFIFATTNPEKIPKTVQSRCLQLNLKTVGGSTLTNHLQKIIELEDISYDQESIELIASSASGSVRDALTLLDQAIAHGNGILDSNNVNKLLGTIDNTLLISLLDSIIDGRGEEAFNYLYKIEELSPEYEVILKNIISIIHQISLHQVLGDSKDQSIQALANKIDAEFCQLLYEITVNAYSKFSVHPNGKEALEICILRMLAFNPLHKIEESGVKKAPIAGEKKTLKIDTVKVQNIKEDKLESENQISQDKIPSSSGNQALKITTKDEWIIFFNTLDLSPFARNYFGYLSFKELSGNILTLNTNDEENSIPENVFKEFNLICREKLESDIEIKIEHGDTSSSPINLKNKQQADTQNIAEKSISSNQSIQNFLKKHNGNIDEGSIKPRG
ncbi:DNA polymerase III subunit gamma/tau [Gammaproteobacteria bacterium]|nr:DNA polymerase III subunit gamma/tau [Gammaproteobacteria bacterium]